MSDREPRDPVALVLAGGGARGAYEAGALSVLLPLLEERGERPRILIGTSVGALNVSFLAANAHLPTDELIANVLAMWESIRWVWYGTIAQADAAGWRSIGGVLARVLPGRGVAAADVSASGAAAQVKPPAAGGEALDTPGPARER